MRYPRSPPHLHLKFNLRRANMATRVYRSMDIARLVHLLAALVWVGGMFFAYLCLRPATSHLEPPQRLKLWVAVLQRFFPWVWGAVVLLPASGYWLIMEMGGLSAVGVYVHLMQGLGIVMMLIFLHVYFVPYRRLRGLVASGAYPDAAKQLNQIRLLVVTNLAIGMIIFVAVRTLRA